MRGVMVGMLVLGLVGCGGTKEPPKTIKDTSRDITAVNMVESKNGKVLNIEMETSSVTGGAGFFLMASDEVLDIMRGVVTYFPEQSGDRARFILSTQLVDKYGNKSSAAVIELGLDMSEVKKINFANNTFTAWDILRFVDQVKYPSLVGVDIIAEYCQKESNQKYAMDFCRLALNG
ncbi:UNVERIFIED_CONTAM: hypothetical protein MT382_08650 [Aeromonas salmonicida]